MPKQKHNSAGVAGKKRKKQKQSKTQAQLQTRPDPFRNFVLPNDGSANDQSQKFYNDILHSDLLNSETKQRKFILKEYYSDFYEKVKNVKQLGRKPKWSEGTPENTLLGTFGVSTLKNNFSIDENCEAIYCKEKLIVPWEDIFGCLFNKCAELNHNKNELKQFVQKKYHNVNGVIATWFCENICPHCMKKFLPSKAEQSAKNPLTEKAGCNSNLYYQYRDSISLVSRFAGNTPPHIAHNTSENSSHSESRATEITNHVPDGSLPPLNLSDSGKKFSQQSVVNEEEASPQIHDSLPRTPDPQPTQPNLLSITNEQHPLHPFWRMMGAYNPFKNDMDYPFHLFIDDDKRNNVLTNVLSVGLNNSGRVFGFLNPFAHHESLCWINSVLVNLEFYLEESHWSEIVSFCEQSNDTDRSYIFVRLLTELFIQIAIHRVASRKDRDQHPSLGNFESYSPFVGMIASVTHKNFSSVNIARFLSINDKGKSKNKFKHCGNESVNLSFCRIHEHMMNAKIPSFVQDWKVGEVEIETCESCNSKSVRNKQEVIPEIVVSQELIMKYSEDMHRSDIPNSVKDPVSNGTMEVNTSCYYITRDILQKHLSDGNRNVSKRFCKCSKDEIEIESEYHLLEPSPRYLAVNFDKCFYLPDDHLSEIVDKFENLNEEDYHKRKFELMSNIRNEIWMPEMLMDEFVLNIPFHKYENTEVTQSVNEKYRVKSAICNEQGHGGSEQHYVTIIRSTSTNNRNRPVNQWHLVNDNDSSIIAKKKINAREHIRTTKDTNNGGNKCGLVYLFLEKFK